MTEKRDSVVIPTSEVVPNELPISELAKLTSRLSTVDTVLLGIKAMEKEAKAIAVEWATDQAAPLLKERDEIIRRVTAHGLATRQPKIRTPWGSVSLTQVQIYGQPKTAPERRELGKWLFGQGHVQAVDMEPKWGEIMKLSALKFHDDGRAFVDGEQVPHVTRTGDGVSVSFTPSKTPDDILDPVMTAASLLSTATEVDDDEEL
jgi:hypothetical protein